MKSKLSQCKDFAVLIKDTGEFTGRAALDTFRDSEEIREIQVVISKDFWGRHFGYEVCKILIAAAFDDLGTKQVVGIVHPENEKSLKLPPQINRLKFVLSRATYERWAHDACQPTETE